MHAAADVISLWPDGSPELGNAPGLGDAPMPTLEMHPAPQSTSRGIVLVLPGGGYHQLVDHERMPVVEWLHAQGFDAALLLYRVKPHALHPRPLHDAQRAMRLLRSGRAGAAAGRPIGVIGFSAGGHGAAMLLTQHDAQTSDHDDLAASVSACPDAAVLCYAVTDFVDPVHRSRGFPLPLMTGREDAAGLSLMSPLRHVRPDMPPLFIWHTAADEVVPVGNSLAFAVAAHAAGAVVELHVPELGGHGQAMWDRDFEHSPLTATLADFLHRHLDGDDVRPHEPGR